LLENNAYSVLRRCFSKLSGAPGAVSSDHADATEVPKRAECSGNLRAWRRQAILIGGVVSASVGVRSREVAAMEYRGMQQID
jgi:hypothetical protein